MSAPYPLLLEPILKPKVWGGRRLAAYGKLLPTDETYGESWEVADLEATSPGGGGGGAARSVVANGIRAGQSLNDVLHEWQGDLVGAAWSDAHAFPLLVKLLDAREHLSVQVHPTEAYARSHPGCHVKTESWLIIEADPGSHLYLGLRPGVDRADVAAAVGEHRITDVLRGVPAVPGDCHHLPSGTVHSLGAGVLVAEIQSPSDTTFRLYDWAAEYHRTERELHVDEALETLLTDEPPPATHLPHGDGMNDLAVTDRYVLRGARGLRSVGLRDGTCTIVMCVDGEAASVEHAGADTPLAKGTTAVIPAAIASDVTVRTDAATILLAELRG